MLSAYSGGLTHSHSLDDLKNNTNKKKKKDLGVLATSTTTANLNIAQCFRVYCDDLEAVGGEEDSGDKGEEDKSSSVDRMVIPRSPPSHSKRKSSFFLSEEEASEEISEMTLGKLLEDDEDTKDIVKMKVEMESNQKSFGSVHKIWGMIKLEASLLRHVSIGMDFVVVIDHSSSMRLDQKLAFVKASIQFFISKLSKQHRFCLIEFNHEVNIVTNGLLEMTKENKSRVLNCLHDIKPEGSTNISDALFLALDVLKERTEGEVLRISSIMLFTDGLANAGLRGKKFIESVTKMIVPPGLTINTFGYGIDHDSKMMQNISFCSKGGVYYYIETIESISASFGECLAGILSTVAHNLKVRISGEDGCRIVSFYTRFPIEEHQPVKDYTVSLGSLFSQEERSILFKVSLRKFNQAAASCPLLKIKLSYTNLQNGKEEEMEIPCSISRPARSSTGPMPLELDKNINRFTAATAMEEAAHKANDANFLGARKHLFDVIEMIKKSISFTDPVYSGYCGDLINDLKECADGMIDSQTFSSGIHYVHAYSTMYFIERSTGTANLLGISTGSTLLHEKKRNLGYGYRSSEQVKGATVALEEARHYVSGYLDSY